MQHASPLVAARRRCAVGVAVVASLLCPPARAADVIDVERAVLVTDGGVVSVDGGVWLSTPRAVEVASAAVQCREENAALRASAGTVEARLIVGVVLASLLVGAGVGYGVAAVVRR